MPTAEVLVSAHLALRRRVIQGAGNFGGTMATMIELQRARSASVQKEVSRSVALAPLLVATDSMESADAAIRMAQTISRRTGRPVKLLAVHEPLPMVGPDVQIAESPDMEAERRTHLRTLVLDQLERVGTGAEWPLEVVTGDAAATIVSVAHSIGASLVIM